MLDLPGSRQRMTDTDAMVLARKVAKVLGAFEQYLMDPETGVVHQDSIPRILVEVAPILMDKAFDGTLWRSV